jgi:hypothetical protein
MKDYIPKNDGDLMKWSDNFSSKIAGYASVLNLSADDVKHMQDDCKQIDGSITDCTQAQALAKKAVKAKLNIIHNGTGNLRTGIQRFKKGEGYTDEIGADLGVIGADDPVNPDTYKPEISAIVFPGRVTVKFTKKGVQGVNIYSKLKDESNWEKLAFDSYSPYEDNRPLHVAGTPEVRQYTAIGVMHDHEIGQMSNIIEVTFGG